VVNRVKETEVDRADLDEQLVSRRGKRLGPQAREWRVAQKHVVAALGRGHHRAPRVYL
jgi:hypothetical protein